MNADTVSSQGWALCKCEKFLYWYTDHVVGEPSLRVCQCGHPESEHIDDVGTCLGEVRVLK